MSSHFADSSSPLGAIAAQPSYVVLPRITPSSPHYLTVLDFLIAKFEQIPADVWLERIKQGKVHWQNGQLISAQTPYEATQRVYYFREVSIEKKVPFTEEILYQDDHKIIAYKPHFLPVTPGGDYVNECLVHRLRLRTGIDTIAPAHRLDKDTAGVMLMTVNPDTRHAYHQLFLDGRIKKTYQAVARLNKSVASQALPQSWTVKNRLQRGVPSFTMQVVDGVSNSHSEIKLLEIHNNLGLFELEPVTGKTHQLRVHMQSLGMPILHDRFYPALQPKGDDNYQQPLQLLAKRLQFIDPISQQVNDWQVKELII
ncbi:MULTISPECIES: pseudouridine synthase [Pseudomonadati]|uniref:Pseudouridine synthase n=1 Tax=Shewanella aestuarii TaxID=1028752 RepID=A0ABT0L102_9GAMM|nr:pseudouridine synthase [Shewanella aestuarii]MCL1117403.1 pseudouridine synthase [Shewanella aestuarii]GGN76085.1 RNA pseudouridylate synthase [Shewanella aestuarii]